jgi:peroxiredoxin Q/BCP
MQRRRNGIHIARGVGVLLVLVPLLFGGALWTSMESRADLIPVGQLAPDFVALASDGTTIHLAGLRGRKRVVLVFYPGDFTPVCTSQLCSFRDSWKALQAENAVTYGVNPADREQHSGFAAKIHLPFPLIMDTRGNIAASYGSRALFGIVKRTVYVLDRQGRVVWAKRGNPPPAEILQILRNLKDNAVL